MIEDLRSSKDRIFIEDLELEHLYFVYPGEKLYQIDENITNKLCQFFVSIPSNPCKAVEYFTSNEQLFLGSVPHCVSGSQYLFHFQKAQVVISVYLREF